MGGSLGTCSPSDQTDCEAKSLKGNATAHHWFGLTVLTAKCQGTDGTVYYKTETNIMLWVAVGLAALLLLIFIFGVMRRRSGSLTPLM